MASSVFDYIVVGAGAAGCAVAARLARDLPDQHILLVDAGGKNAEEEHQDFGGRHWTLAAENYNWGYKTVPQDNLDARAIDYSRGKGLGGSTSINFCVYTRGPRSDYDQWAKVVDDDIWSWEKTRLRFQRIENVSVPGPDFEDFVRLAEDRLETKGPVHVGVTESWDTTFGDFLRRAYHYYPKNLDHNSGDPIGISICQQAAYDGKRTTAAGAYLASPPANLDILTQSPITKLIIERDRVTGAEASEEKIYAKQEVILAAGAVDTPKLLLLSGIGPAQDLQSLGIPVVRDLPGIGKNLQDRLFLELVTIQEPGSHHRTSYIDSPAALEQAREEWMKDKSGPLGGYYLPQMMAYLKGENVLSSKEFLELDTTLQGLLKDESKPHFELISQNPSPSVKSPEIYLATAVAFQGNHSTGSITLTSRDPNEAPVIDPKFLAHSYDRRLAIESVRQTLKFLDQPLMAAGSTRFAAAPEGGSDEDILDYIRKSATSMWHPCGTVKMGNPKDPATCIDKDFRVIGVRGLRVVDMSVAPFLPSAHLQAVAYLIGETAAEKILGEKKQW